MLGMKWRSQKMKILQAALLILLADVALAQGLTGPRYPITQGDIAKALRVAGVSVEMSHVSLPVQMSATVAEPKLEIVTADPLGTNQVALKLRCYAASECLPFVAFAVVEDPKSAADSIRSKITSTTPARHLMDSRMTAAPASKSSLKVGSRAVMEMRDGHMEIHLQVLAMDDGALGQQVRVCTLDRKKTFRATVTGEGTVTGEME